MHFLIRRSYAWNHAPASLLAVPLLLAFFVLATAYSVVTPLWEAPDEGGHFSFIAQLLTTRTLPVQRVGQLGEAHQPPLYYAMAALAASAANFDDPAGSFKPNPRFMWAGQGGNDVNAALHTSDETFPYHGQALAFHLARELSVLLGMTTVALTIATGWMIFPQRRLIGLLSGALVAFNPQFLFASGALNNDNLLTLAATGSTWQALQAMKWPERRRQWLFLGLWIAVGILAKSSGLVIALVAAMVLLACAIERRSFKLFISGAVPIVAVVIALTGWWFVRNQLLYGDPLGWATYLTVFDVNIRHSPLQWSDLRELFDVQFRSFWGVFGWMNVSPPSWFYTAVKILLLLSLIGLALFVATQIRSRKRSPYLWAALTLLILVIVMQEAFMVGTITRCNASCYQGRYLFPVIGPLMILVALGIVSLLPKRLAPPAATGLALALAGIAIFMAVDVVGPAYRMIPLPQWSLWFLSKKTDFAFGQMFELKGYEVRQDANASQLVLALYWRALKRPDRDYSVFTHLINGADQLVAQEDHAPGANVGYPPRAWWTGDIMPDEHTIRLPAQLTPGTYRLRVGVYNAETGEQMAVLARGAPIGTFVILDEQVQP